MTIPTEADNLAHSVRNAVEALRCAADSARYLGRHEQSTRYTFLAYKVAATITTTTKGTS